MPNLPETMNAITISEPGGPDVLEPQEVRTPIPSEGQLLIKVATAGVNRPDVLQRRGLYPPPEGHSKIPGLEVAGSVAAAGSGTSRFKPGDQVTALVNGGGYAEYCIAEEAITLPAPESISLAQAGALPETVFTVWHNVFERGGLKSGEWLLVHGGSSGIGTTAIQLAKAFDARVMATAGSAEKCTACEELGADLAVNYNKVDFVQAAKSVGGIDVILDMVGGDYIERNFKSAKYDGRIVQIAFLKGAKADVNFMPLMLKRLTLTGSTLRARTKSVKGSIAKAVEQNVWPLIETKKFRPVMDSSFPLTEANEAHKRMETSQHIGKIVLDA